MGVVVTFDIDLVMALLEDAVLAWDTPAVTIISQRDGDPFKVLVSCILSLRTKDTTTGPASLRLFSLADSPQKMLGLSVEQIEEAIYPVCFYRNKAGQILEICRELVEKYDGKVPDSIEELLRFKGVGRKTANLVVTLGFSKPGICVDTHVHRICNHWGYLSTKTPDETEFRLREILPHKYWLRINDLLVTFGQNLCRPVSPFCSICPLYDFCKRKNVVKNR
ncbi:MAG: endonuclease III [Geobacteraceae bacterium]|nr:endonuclease III [Geobacteraceae bacterium]